MAGLICNKYPIITFYATSYVGWVEKPLALESLEKWMGCQETCCCRLLLMRPWLETFGINHRNLLNTRALKQSISIKFQRKMCLCDSVFRGVCPKSLPFWKSYKTLKVQDASELCQLILALKKFIVSLSSRSQGCGGSRQADQVLGHQWSSPGRFVPLSHLDPAAWNPTPGKQSTRKRGE